MKYLIITILTLSLSLTFYSCGSSVKAQNERRGLMLLDPSEHGRNKKMTSPESLKKRKRTAKKLKRRNRRAAPSKGRGNNVRTPF